MTGTVEVTAYLIGLAAKASVILAAAAIISRLARRAPAAARHSVWLAATAATLALPGGMALVPQFTVRVAGVPQRTTAHVILTPALLRAPSEPRQETSSSASGLTPDVRAAEQGASIAPLPPIQNTLAIVFWAWAIGASLFLARIAIDVWRTRRLIAGARSVSAPAFRALVDQFGGSAAARRVRVMESARVTTPMTAGLWAPVILLPIDRDGWSDADRRAVVAHEVAHMLRHDCAAQLAARVMRALHWFNPLTWYAVRAMRAEAEHACDDRVIGAGALPLGYAELLVQFARGPIGAAHSHVAISMASLGGELERRLEAIVDPAVKRGMSSVVQRAGVVVATALVFSAARSTANHCTMAISSPSGPRGRLLARAGSGWWIHSSMRSDPADWRECAYAAWALAGVAGRRTLVPLLALLEHPVWRARASAAAALASGADAGAARGMITALQDESWQVRIEAVKYFGVLGDTASMAVIRPALKDEHIAVRSEAQSALSARRSPR